jgi:inorganic phosphate transporter, PiT family
MHSGEVLLVLVILISLGFDYVNGFHDTANAIALVVSTRVMSPRAAILMAASLNFVGALASTHVAKTITSGLVDPRGADQAMALAAVLAAIAWNLITWKFGIPSSSSHALVGGIVGASIVHGGFRSVLWSGLLNKVIYPLIGSPLFGFAIGFAIMIFILAFFARASPGRMRTVFTRLQMVAAAAKAFNHGQNDAQKSMGIITLALVAHGALPGGSGPPIWVILLCAGAMAMGTSAGGWRIMKTMGHRILKLDPAHGFAADAAASITIALASWKGMPVSTTHVTAGSVFGVGASKRLSAVRWGVAQSMLIAWVLTIPCAGIIAALLDILFHQIGIKA